MVGRNQQTGLVNPFREDRAMSAPDFYTADGKSVYIGTRSHIDGSLSYVHDAISKVDTRLRRTRIGTPVPRSTSGFIIEEIEYPTNIGHDIVVVTKRDDDVFYAQREGHSGLSRLVRGKDPTPTNYFTVIMVEQYPGAGTYLLLRARVGRKRKLEPCDFPELYRCRFNNRQRKTIREQSRLFWVNHAFVAAYVYYAPVTASKEQPKDWFAVPTSPDEVQQIITRRRFA